VPLEAQVGRPLVAGPGAEVVGGPGGQVDALQVGQPGLGVGPGEKQQRLDDPPEPDGVVVEPVQDALVLLDGAPAAALILDVPSADLFTARAGGGAFRNGRRIAVSTIAEPARALIGTGFPFKYPEQIGPYMRQIPAIFRATAGVRRAGSAALDLADVACGRFDAFWELRLAPWDLAAGLLLIREAGGIVTDLDGAEAPVAHGPVVAGNPLMHRWLLAELRAASGER
jgi:hypothetical protein